MKSTLEICRHTIHTILHSFTVANHRVWTVFTLLFLGDHFLNISLLFMGYWNKRYWQSVSKTTNNHISNVIHKMEALCDYHIAYRMYRKWHSLRVSNNNPFDLICIASFRPALENPEHCWAIFIDGHYWLEQSNFMSYLFTSIFTPRRTFVQYYWCKLSLRRFLPHTLMKYI